MRISLVAALWGALLIWGATAAPPTLAQSGPSGADGVSPQESVITLTKTVEVYSYEDLIFTIDNYAVSPGDNIEGILKKQGLWPTSSATLGREAQIMRLVAELNPAIANLDQISPGQNLYLPAARPQEEIAPELASPGGRILEDVVTYELRNPDQSPATVVVRRPPGGGAETGPLPEGVWPLRVDRGADGEILDNPVAPTPSAPSAQSAPSVPSASSAPTSRAAGGNDGALAMLSDGTVYRTVTVKRGDTLEKLLRREGLDPNLIYRHLIKLTVSLNSAIRNPNMIIEGAELRIPAFGDYLAAYGDAGPEVRYAQAGDSVSDAQAPLPRGNAPAASKFRVETKRLPPAPLPTADSQNAREVLAVVFTRLGETVASKGRLFLPLDEPPHFDVDTSSMPVIELRNGRKVILDLNRTLKADFIGRFRAKYPDYTIFQPSRGESMEKALERLWPMCGYYRVYGKDKSFEGGRDVKLKLSADWLVWPTDGDWNKGQPVVINLAPSQDNGTPLPWVKFLTQHNILVVDLFKGQLLAASARGATPVNNFTIIDQENDNASAFAAALVKSFGFSPRLGVKVDLVAGRIATGGENLDPNSSPAVFWESGDAKTILEYGDLTTEELSTLRQNGFQVISSARDVTSVLKSILAALNVKLGGPLVLNGDSSGGPKITLTIAGQTFTFNERTYLFTSVELPDNMTGLDPNQNVVVLKYRGAPLSAPPPAAPQGEAAPDGGIVLEDETPLTSEDI
ncbi:MAG: LysM peptidoglycan-binding domain-containing protein [Deltaproteobacteria bacterium]|jgi:hypothetical protein|nr:LysM peptidoglycan-binding domain-containing protein [Deltaproteobacteria bacterium]